MYLAIANSVDPDKLASEEANWSGSTLSLSMWICLNNLDQVFPYPAWTLMTDSNNLIGWKLEVGVAC